MSEISSNFFILSEICPKSEKIARTFLSKNIISNSPKVFEVNAYAN